MSRIARGSRRINIEAGERFECIGVLMEQQSDKAHLNPGEGDTAERLLAVAERLFAERGYTRTTVVEITQQAQCNISAVNYHFHGKEELYLAVFRSAVSDLGEPRRHRTALADMSDASLEQLVEATVRDFVAPFLGKVSGQRLTKLVLQERDDPHLPKNFFRTEVIEPLRRATIEPLKQICSALDDATVELCLDSIVAQLLYLVHTWSFFKDVDTDQMPILEPERAINHIVAFSIAGVRHFLECRNHDR